MKIKSIIILILALANMVGLAQSFEPKWAGQVVLLSCEGDTVSIPTEKANVQIKTSSSTGRILFGIGNLRSKAIIQGRRSPVQVDANKPITLIVKWKDNHMDPTGFIQILKFEENKKERSVELANVNWVGNVSEGNVTIIPYEADVYGKSSYILTLEPVEGEFGVLVLNPEERDEKVTIFNCFGSHAQ